MPDKQEIPGSEIRAVERVELFSKGGAAALALTYVSGYLIVNTYLGTYGIESGQGELFRAKYIYVGFLYWVFASVFVLIGVVIIRAFDQRKKEPQPDPDEEKRIADVTSAQSREKDRLASWPLRPFVFLLLQVALGLELLFVKPGQFQDYAPYLVGMLLCTAVYQMIYFRSMDRGSGPPPNLWGRLYGRRYLGGLKVFCAFIESICLVAMIMRMLGLTNIATLAIAVLARILGVPNFSETHLSVRVFLAIVVPLLFSAPLVPLTWNYRSLRYIDLEWRLRQKPSTSLRKEPESQGGEKHDELRHFEPRTLIATCLLFVLPLGNMLMVSLMLGFIWNSSTRNLLLEYGAMVLSLITLSNIFLVGMIRSGQREAQKPGWKADVLAIRERTVGGTLPKETDEQIAQRERLARQFSTKEIIVRFILRVVPGAMCYLLSTLFFAHLIYNWVPFDKSGGDYTSASAVIMHHVTRESTRTKNGGDELCEQADQLDGVKLVVLEQDERYIYASFLYDPDGSKTVELHPGKDSVCGPPAWRTSGWKTAERMRPRVYAIDRHCIGYLEQLEEVSKQFNCMT